MSDDHFNYDQLMLDAHRDLIRNVLLKVEQTGLPGEHHFFIIFSTTHHGTRISDRLRAQYPEEMTIVLQHQYSNLNIQDDYFEIQLSFNRIPELLVIPFAAITGFVDPSVPFGLQLAGDANAGLESNIGMLVPGLPQPATGYEPSHEADTAGEFATPDENEHELEADFEVKGEETSVPSIFSSKSNLREVTDDQPIFKSVPKSSQEDEDDTEEKEQPTANVVQLDAFRKKSK